MVDDSAPVLAIEHLQVCYYSGREIVRAVQDATLYVGEGEAVGLAGESGSGKSTVARAALGLLPRSTARVEAGRITVTGRDATHLTERAWQPLRGNPVAMIFQDPLSYLNPVLRVGKQIAEAVRLHDHAARRSDRVAEVLELVGLQPAHARAYPHELSGGMRQRVLIAIALACRPRLLIADEPTTALDVTTQAEILALLSRLQKDLGLAILLISHDLAVISSLCSRLYVMYGGYSVESGSTARVFSHPAHPYTAALFRAAANERDETGHFATVRGDVADSMAQALGCPFAPRCPHTMPCCLEEMPPRSVLRGEAEHDVRCWLVGVEEGEIVARS